MNLDLVIDWKRGEEEEVSTALGVLGLAAYKGTSS